MQFCFIRRLPDPLHNSGDPHLSGRDFGLLLLWRFLAGLVSLPVYYLKDYWLTISIT
jgi:hypothetical protein